MTDQGDTPDGRNASSDAQTITCSVAELKARLLKVERRGFANGLEHAREICAAIPEEFRQKANDKDSYYGYVIGREACAERIQNTLIACLKDWQFAPASNTEASQ